MRQLTKKQKIVIDKAYSYNPKIRDYQDLPDDVWQLLVKINDTEILHTEVNRYLWDKVWSNL